MKKNSSRSVSEKTEGKGVFYRAGEMIGSIGFHIVDGKDKVIGAIKKKLGKKQTSKTKSKKIPKKKTSEKAGKKTTGVVKKTAGKSTAGKSVRKKTGKVKTPSNASAKKDIISATK